MRDTSASASATSSWNCSSRVGPSGLSVMFFLSLPGRLLAVGGLGAGAALRLRPREVWAVALRLAEQLVDALLSAPVNLADSCGRHTRGAQLEERLHRRPAFRRSGAHDHH